MSAFVEYTLPIWRNLNMRKLKVDEAYLVSISHYSENTHLYMLSSECYTCPFSKLTTIKADSVANKSINIAKPLYLKLFKDDVGPFALPNESAICEFDGSFMREFGVYNLTVDESEKCALIEDKDGVNIHLSILSVFIVFSVICVILRFTLWRKYFNENGAYNVDSAECATENTASTTTIQKKRMRSLDAFRGFAIVLMIFVNSGGGDYWWIEHAAWNGLHLADIVFPSFLWIMGVCIPISIKSQLMRETPKWLICRRIFWRSLKLFLIGLCLNSINGPQLENLRIMGVLQRFGLAYLVCAILHTVFSKKDFILPQVAWKRYLFDLLLFRGEFLLMLTLIAIHLGIIFGLNTPNCPRGYLGPGGKHANAAYPNCIGGATGYIDVQILGKNHIYQHPTAKYIYDSAAFDPEGVFGCLLTIVQVLFGVLCGVQILVFKAWKARIQRWLTWSVWLGLIGGLLCSFSKDIGPIPINKNLWSLSFVLVTTALAFAVLSILYYIIDVESWWYGFPFVESGKNAIIMYVGHTIMHKMLPWHWRIGAMNTHFILLLEAIWNTLIWIAIALYLDEKEFYYSL